MIKKVVIIPYVGFYKYIRIINGGNECIGQMYGEGDSKYKAEGGTMEFDALSLLSSKSYHALKETIKQNLEVLFQFIRILKELTGRIGGSAFL